jgi:hypothetical protein
MISMAWKRTDSSDNKTRAERGVPLVVAPPAGTNDNAQGADPAEQHPRWPLAVIATGLLLSMLWCVGLLAGAYRLLDWAGVLP